MGELTDSVAPPAPAPKEDFAQVVARLARPGLTLGLSFGSFFLALGYLLGFETAADFFVQNRGAIQVRTAVLGGSLILALVTVAVAVMATFQKEGGQERLENWAAASAPLVVSSFIPPLFFEAAWNGREAAFLAYAFAVGLGLERLLGPSLEAISEWRFVPVVKERLAPIVSNKALGFIPLTVVLALAAWYIARIGTLSNISHMKLMTMSSDLAEYDNLFFNALSGHPFRAPAVAGHLEDFSNLMNHAEFGLYILLPFYAIAPGAHTLLWIQTCIVAFTALPIFLLASDRIGKWGGLAFAVAFFLMPAVQQPNFYDFHFTPLAMFFSAWVLYFVSRLESAPTIRGRVICVYVALGLSLLCREDTSIGTAVLGLFLILSGKIVRHGLIIAAVSTAYFLFMKFTFMPLFGTWWFDNMYDDLKADGSKGFSAVILTLGSNPSFVLRNMLIEPKFLYVLHMTVPLLALWLRRPLLWLAFLPGLVQTLLVTNRPPMFQSSFQYTYHWLPYVVAASILATRRDLRGKGTLVSIVLVAFALSHQMCVFPSGDSIMGGFARKTFEVSPEEKKRYSDLKEIISLMPKDAVVGVTEAEGPHVSARPVMYSLKYTLGPFPEYLLISHPRHRGESEHVRRALESGKYGVIAQRGGFVLAKLGADASKNDVLWRKIGGRKPAGRRPRPRPAPQ